MLKQVTLLVCGGMHPPSYTGQVLSTIAEDRELSRRSQVICAPQQARGVLSPFALRQALESSLENSLEKSAAEAAPPALIIWAFSAGCVGAAALATHWQRYRGRVLALFMADGWGVPRDPGVPVHRLSHDQITHDTSRWLGSGDEDFYADPAVPHLTLWQQPQMVTGWAIASGSARESMTAAEFLCGRSRDCIDRYQRLNEG
ncbi:MAG: hypothetical protein DCF21_17405 [Leptolyngbya sp.]|nr:MAG: hypothetical protein DCF21_17405 [Leptolyngbya sp.]